MQREGSLHGGYWETDSWSVESSKSGFISGSLFGVGGVEQRLCILESFIGIFNVGERVGVRMGE